MIAASQDVRQCVPSHLSAHTAHIDKEDARPSGAPLHNLLSRSELLHLHVGGGIKSMPLTPDRLLERLCAAAQMQAPTRPGTRASGSIYKPCIYAHLDAGDATGNIRGIEAVEELELLPCGLVQGNIHTCWLRQWQRLAGDRGRGT